MYSQGNKITDISVFAWIKRKAVYSVIVCLAFGLASCSTVLAPKSQTMEEQLPLSKPETRPAPVENVFEPMIGETPPVDIALPPLPVPEIVSPEVSEFEVYRPGKLVYGQPLPLVCSHRFPAEKQLKKRPNAQVMWENYLHAGPEGVWAEVGGAVEYNGCLSDEQGGWRNACTVRLSHMLNRAGHKIPFIKDQTVSGGNGDQYFFRLNDIQAYLIRTYGKPDIDTGDGIGLWHDIPKVPGLILFKYPGFGYTGHASIWNGERTVDDVKIWGHRILFWRLPCFIPKDRENSG